MRPSPVIRSSAGRFASRRARRLAAAIAAAMAACAGAALADTAPRPVGVVVVEPTQYSEVVALTGEIAARISASLAFKTGGQIAEINVDVGDHVEAGETLARLDPAEQAADVAANEAAVASAEATLRLARTTFERQSALLTDGFTPRSAYEDAREAMETARGRLDVARADLDAARANLADATLKAEAAGTITSREIERGQVVGAAQTAFGFAQDGPRDAVFHIQEQLLTRVDAANPEAARPIRIALVNDPDVRAIGHVREISPLVDAQTGTVQAKVGLEDAPPQMSLGAAVAGYGAGPPVEAAILLPWNTLLTDRGAPAVWVVDPSDGRVSLRRVEVASYDGDRIVVASGLAAGEIVVTEGAQLLHPGETVSYDGARQ